MSDSPGRTVCSACGRTFAEGERFCPFDRTDLRPEWARGEDPLVGTELGGSYTILAKLGAGGMGVVYRARQNRLRRDVAVKILSTALAADKAAEERFRTEALAVSQLSNAHTVGIYDFGATDDGRVYLVMQLVEGVSLRSRIGGRPLAVRSALTIAAHIAESLAEAHDKRPQIIHRDVKPDNVLVRRTPDGEDFATVLDFGLAKLADTERMTVSGLIIGTPAYMAPEQARNEERLDARLDLYALGVVLYEMLTGRPPFAAASAAALLYQHVWDPPPPLTQMNPAVVVPEAVQELVFQLLAKDPDSRPPTASVVRARLLEILRLLPVTDEWAPDTTAPNRPEPTTGVSPAAVSPRFTAPALSPRPTAPAQVRRPVLVPEPPVSHETPTEAIPSLEDAYPQGAPPAGLRRPSQRLPLALGALTLLALVAFVVVRSWGPVGRSAQASTAPPEAPASLAPTAPPPPAAVTAAINPEPRPIAPTRTAGLDSQDLPLDAVRSSGHRVIATPPPPETAAVDTAVAQPAARHGEEHGRPRTRTAHASTPEPPTVEKPAAPADAPAAPPAAPPAAKPASPGGSGDFPIVPL